MDESLPLTKILIHSDYGAYGMFSEEFKQAFEETYHIDFDDLPSYDPYFDKKNKNKYIETRYDTRLIDIFEKLGVRRSTENVPEHRLLRSSLKVVEIPTMLLDVFYISEYDGAEWIWCNVSKKYKDVLLDVINSDKNSLGDVAVGEVAETHDETKVKSCIENAQRLCVNFTRCEEFLTANNIRFI